MYRKKAGGYYIKLFIKDAIHITIQKISLTSLFLNLKKTSTTKNCHRKTIIDVHCYVIYLEILK